MNLVETIAQGHSKAQCDRIVKYIGNDPGRFQELVRVFLAGPYRITQRAAWPLSYCVERNPELIRPHLKTIINNLKRPGFHDAVKRNTVRLMQSITIPPLLARAGRRDLLYSLSKSKGTRSRPRFFHVGVSTDRPGSARTEK